MYNNSTLVGRVVAQPELRYLPTGTAVAGFTLAVDRARKDSQGNKVTDFLQVTTWGKLAENCANYLDRGKLALVSGELHIDKWEKDGQKYSAPKIQANEVKFLSPKSGGQSLGTEVPFDQDNPF